MVRRERAVLAGYERGSGSPSTAAKESFEELAELARSAGAEIAAAEFQVRSRIDPATLFGRGKIEELRDLAHASHAELLIVDNELSPTWQRNIEDLSGLRVVDRTRLILDIFASRARTAQGRLQVELAQLKYLLPRLTGKGIALSRLGGGIGTRGPGETRLEVDRRRISIRIKKLEADLEKVRAGRALHRRKRESIPLPTVSLVGYTNAGKSTLFNRLAGAGVLADAKMFATLDPTVRAVTLPSRRTILLADTVGFVRNLPAPLIEAFRATLEEVSGADLLLHVVDASADGASRHIAEVFRVLGEIDAASLPQILVLNKSDCIDATERDPSVLGVRLLAESGQSPLVPVAMVSGLTGEGIGSLLALIDKALPFDVVETVTFRIPISDGASRALLHSRGRVRREEFKGSACEIEAEAPESLRRQLARFIAKPRTLKSGKRAVENSVKK